MVTDSSGWSLLATVSKRFSQILKLFSCILGTVHHFLYKLAPFRVVFEAKIEIKVGKFEWNVCQAGKVIDRWAESRDSHSASLCLEENRQNNLLKFLPILPGNQRIFNLKIGSICAWTYWAWADVKILDILRRKRLKFVDFVSGSYNNERFVGLHGVFMSRVTIIFLLLLFLLFLLSISIL